MLLSNKLNKVLEIDNQCFQTHLVIKTCSDIPSSVISTLDESLVCFSMVVYSYFQLPSLKQNLYCVKTECLIIVLYFSNCLIYKERKVLFVYNYKALFCMCYVNYANFSVLWEQMYMKCKFCL